MLSSTHQNSDLSIPETIYSSFLRKAQNWVRREILADDPYDDAASQEEALITELHNQEQIHHDHQRPSSSLTSEFQENSSMLRHNLPNPNFL